MSCCQGGLLLLSTTDQRETCHAQSQQGQGARFGNRMNKVDSGDEVVEVTVRLNTTILIVPEQNELIAVVCVLERKHVIQTIIVQ